MSLVTRNPFQGALSLRGEPDLFSELWSAPFFSGNAAAAVQGFVPRIDAVETEDEYRISAELPGLEEKDFSVELEDGVLTIKGEKRSHVETGDEGEGEGGGYRRIESSWGRFERRMRFDAPIDEENVKASYKNGVLTVVVPKPAEQRPQARQIAVESS